MSEAAQLLPEIEQPHVRPVGVTARQWRLAAIYPRCKTAMEALLQAGYARTTALAQASKTLDTVGVQRARAAQDQARLDSARSVKGIKASVLPHIAKHVKDGMDLTDALNVLSVTAKIVQDGGDDEEQAVTELDRQDANNYIKAIVERILVATGIDPHVLSTAQLIDTMLLTGPASDNGPYVNSPIPPSTLLLPGQSMTVDAATVPCTPAKRGPGRPRKQA